VSLPGIEAGFTAYPVTFLRKHEIMEQKGGNCVRMGKNKT
jgi:hypothetical protein